LKFVAGRSCAETVCQVAQPRNKPAGHIVRQKRIKLFNAAVRRTPFS
jgi:hypothetical protein